MILVIANPYSRFAKKDGLKKIEKIIASTKKEVIYVKTSSVEELNGRLIKKMNFQIQMYLGFHLLVIKLIQI